MKTNLILSLVIHFFIDILIILFLVFMPENVRVYLNYYGLGIEQIHLNIFRGIFLIISIAISLLIIKTFKMKNKNNINYDDEIKPFKKI